MPLIVLPIDDAAWEVPAAFVSPPDDSRDTDAMPIAVAEEFEFTLPAIVITSRWAADAYVLSPPVYHCETKHETQVRKV